MITRSRRLAVCLGTLLFGLSVPGAAQEVLGYLAVPDPEATLRHAEAVVEVFTPGQTPPGTLRKTIGAMLGDPSLASLAAGQPLMVAFFVPEAPGQPPGFALFVPVKDPAPIDQALTAKGFKTQVTEGLLLAAQAEATLRSAAGALATYLSLRDTRPGSDLQLWLRASRVVDLYGPVAQAGIESIGPPAAPKEPKPQVSPPPAPSPEARRLVKLEAKAFLALAGQVEEARVDLTLGPQAIESETVLLARAGTALAAFATMPAIGPSVTRSLVSGPGTLAASYQMDPVRLSAFVGQVLDEASKDKDAAELLDPETIAWVRDFYRSCGSEGSMRMTAAPGQPLSLDWAMAASDETRCLAGIEKGVKLLGPGSPLGGAYQSMGLHYDVSFERAVRRYAGVDVHRVRIRIEGPQAEQMKAFAHDTELALTHGVYLAAQDPQRLDELIDRALRSGPADAASEAVKAFGAGHHAYAEYDVIGMLKAMGPAFASQHQPPGGNPFAALPDSAEPITWAMSLADGRIRSRSRIPLQPFALMAKTMAKPPPSPAAAPK